MATRVTEALLDGKAQSEGATNPMLDLRFGGQMGYSNVLGEWVSNAAYVQRNIFPILIAAPKFFQNSTHSASLVAQLRALVELHPRSIEGLQSGLSVETASTPVGGAGEEQDEVTNVVRARSTPTFSYFEKYGRPIQSFLSWWIQYGLMDPDTKQANVGTLASGYPDDMLPDQYAMTMLFIEPDPTHRKVVKSWLCTNMFPKGTGDILGRRDVTASLTLQELSIEFSAITQVGLGVDRFAQQVMDTVNITNANPYLREAFINEVSQEVLAANVGYEPGISNLAATAVQATGNM